MIRSLRIGKRAALIQVVLVAMLALHCSLVAKNDLRYGIGKSCAMDGECQAGICERGTCVTPCSGDTDCPLPSLCLREPRASAGTETRCRLGCRTDAHCAQGEFCEGIACLPTLKVGVLFGGPTNGEDGATSSQKNGLDEAAVRLRFVRFRERPYAARESVRDPEALSVGIKQFTSEGASVIVSTSAATTDELLRQAPRYPDVKFIAAGASRNGGLANVGAYRGKGEQAWYAAGRLAARVAAARNKCVGMILPTPTKQIIRETNAFIRGGRAQEPELKVVVRWLGGLRDTADAPSYPYTAATYDYDSDVNGRLFREELLAAQIADLGCTLVGHRTETHRVANVIEKRLKTPVKTRSDQDLFSLAVDLHEGCRENATSSGTWLRSCLATVYTDWGGTYTKLFDQIQRGVWTGEVVNEEFRTDASAIAKLELGPYPSVTGIAASDARRYVEDAANRGSAAVFEGPYRFNGQRDLDKDGKPDARQFLAAGERLSDEELGRMCWFVDGAYELASPTDVRYEALIPAVVPYGPAVAGTTSTVEPEDAASRAKYSDVIDYLQSVGVNPASAMDCTIQ